jgi:hypothetical protein
MAQDPKKADSVYDFLYIDSKRIALFLSQFSNYGHLTALTKTATDTKSIDGKVDVKIASVESHEIGQSGLSKQYDAQWVAPLTFLDEADQRNMIERDIGAAGFGNLVLASGELEVRDLRMIMQALNLPAMKALQSTPEAPPVDRRERNERRRNRPREQNLPTQAEAQQAFGSEFMGLLPHGTQAMLRSEKAQVWCGLKEDCLITSSSELFLSHGVKIPGRWNILGILDARPDAIAEFGTPEQEYEIAKAAVPSADTGLLTIVTQGFGGFIDGIAPLARMMLGRSSASYGMTPLLIFREISRKGR